MAHLGISDHDKNIHLWEVGQLCRAGLAHEHGVSPLAGSPRQAPHFLSRLQEACNPERPHHYPCNTLMRLTWHIFLARRNLKNAPG